MSGKLYKKVLEVMKDVSYLQKDGKVQFGTTKYSAVTIEKVVTSVRESMIKNGLIIMPVDQQYITEKQILKDKHVNERLNRIGILKITYRLADVDSNSSGPGTGAFGRTPRCCVKQTVGPAF